MLKSLYCDLQTKWLMLCFNIDMLNYADFETTNVTTIHKMIYLDIMLFSRETKRDYYLNVN